MESTAKTRKAWDRGCLNEHTKISYLPERTKKNPELKNSVNEIKKAMGSISSMADKMKKRINDLEDRNFEITQRRRSNKDFKRAKKAYVSCGISSKEKY